MSKLITKSNQTKNVIYINNAKQSIMEILIISASINLIASKYRDYFNLEELSQLLKFFR